MMILTGPTYEHRDTIKRIPGVRWDAERKAWTIRRDTLTMHDRQIQQAALHTLRQYGIREGY